MKKISVPTLLVAFVAAFAFAQTRTWATPRTFASIANAEVNESSGIAPSYDYAGQFYTHNDSGDRARFFRFDQRGQITAEWSLAGVEARDWEDMETAEVDGNSFVFIGDIGDNNAKHDHVKIYRFREPKGDGGTIRQFDTFKVTYPGGPRNAEALMVDPKTGDIWVVEKRQGEAGIYRLRSPRRSGTYQFQFMGRIWFPDGLAPLRVITGGSVSPDGKNLVLRTYAYAYEFPVPGREFRSWLTTKSTRIEVAREVQGEAICYSKDGNSLLTTSEGSPCVVSRMALNR